MAKKITDYRDTPALKISVFWTLSTLLAKHRRCWIWSRCEPTKIVRSRFDSDREQNELKRNFKMYGMDHLLSSSGWKSRDQTPAGLKRLQWNQFFFVQNFVWKNYPLLLVESTSNFAWLLFWRKFSSRVLYFCQILSASKIFVKLLFIWAGLDVFPFKMMKKEACHRVQHDKISSSWSSSFVGRLCACLKNQTFERQWKMCSTGLNACNLGYGVSVHESAIVVMANMANTGKTVQIVRWSSRKRRVVQAYWTRDRRNDFPGPPFSTKVPPNGVRAIFSSINTKNANSVSLRK